MTTLKATLRQVNQTEVTVLRQQLRQTLHQHCTVHIPAPPSFRCHAAREDCICLQVVQSQPIYINIEQDTPTPDSQADTPMTADPITSPATDRSTMEADSSTSSDPPATPPPPTDTEHPSLAIFDQYTQDLQAFPALLQSLGQPPAAHGDLSDQHAQTEPKSPTLSTKATATSPSPLPTEPTPPSPMLPKPSLPEVNDHNWCIRPYPVTPPSSSASPRWQQLIQDPSELDIKSYSCGKDTDFQAGTLNIGGSLRNRITDITFTFAATRMDYLCLQDTRQTKREGLAIASTIRELLPPGTLVFQAPITKLRPSDPPPIGGQMILISHRWSHHANHWYHDPTQRGILTGITLSNKHSKIRLLRSYWPVPHAANQHSLSLHAHVVHYLQ